MSGSVSARTTKNTAERVTAGGQLQLPGPAGSVPVKSTVSASPSIVTATRIQRSSLGHAVALQRLGGLVAPVGHRGDGRRACGARRSRGAPPNASWTSAVAVALGHLGQPALGQAVGRELRAQVALALARRAGVGQHQVAGRPPPGSPPATSRTGGMTRPSCSSSREPAGMLPGAMPPTSAWWARVTA